jgi:hypothetical protein
MIHRGRDRYKTHSGIPYGSTCNLSTKLTFAFLWNQDVSAASWEDQGVNGNTATNEVDEEQATLLSDGSLDFESGNAQHYDLNSEVTISAQEGWCCFIVCNIESTGSNKTILGLSASHFLEFKQNADAVRYRGGTTTTQIDPGDGTRNDFDAGTKMLVTINREAGATGNLNLWKNGVELAQDSQASNPGDGEFTQISCRNADRYFDGIIYDLVFIDGGSNTSDVIERINAYLTSKHGLN